MEDREIDEPFLASLIPGRVVKTFSRHTLRKRFRTACKVLGAARLESLTIHHGRHTFISHALAGGRSLAEVRDTAGHANVSITSGYLHVAVDDETAVGCLFRFASAATPPNNAQHDEEAKLNHSTFPPTTTDAHCRDDGMIATCTTYRRRFRTRSYFTSASCSLRENTLLPMVALSFMQTVRLWCAIFVSRKSSADFLRFVRLALRSGYNDALHKSTPLTTSGSLSASGDQILLG